MNKKLNVVICVVLAVLLLAGCGKSKNNEGTAATDSVTGEIIPQKNEITETTGDSVPDDTQTASTIATEKDYNSVQVTDPVTGETTGSEVSMGVEKGEENTPEEEEDDEPSNPSNPTTPTNPTETTAPEQETTPPTQDSKPEENGQTMLPNGLDIRDITYEMYMAMSGEEQQAVINMFGSTEDFMVWFNAVKAIYEAQHPDIEIGNDGTVDAGQGGR